MIAQIGTDTGKMVPAFNARLCQHGGIPDA